ncbi:MAG: BlaI/MecI/CopY family transcriptional regulator [Gemmatimonadaceae bacterium]
MGDRELDVMATLWREGPGTVAEVRDRLPVTLAYNTVLTILRNLETKGFVNHTATGRLFTYHPLLEEEQVRGNALSRLVAKLFNGSVAHVVAHLVDDEKLSRDELRALHRALDERLRESTPSAHGKAELERARPADGAGPGRTPRSRRRK